MSGMANEMAARMREDGLDPAGDRITPGAPDPGAAEPGTERPTAPAQPAPPAGAQNTDMPRDGEEPGPVPYSRFREVNEGYQKLRPYETLAEYGYDADSLGRLAQFEAAWVQDPHGTVAQMVANLDLPDDQKNQIIEQITAESGDGSSGGGTPATPSQPSADGEEMPAWFRPYAEREQQRERAVAEERENAEREARLDAVVSHWDRLDEEDGIQTPEGIKLSLIASYASSGRYPTPAALAEAARKEALTFRETALGSTVVPSRNGIGPRSVPRSAATPAPPQQFKSFKEATAAAKAAMDRGELPPITPGG